MRPGHRREAVTRALSDPNQLSMDQFAIIADWYHFAILNLINTPGFKSDISWIAKRLGLFLYAVDGPVPDLFHAGQRMIGMVRS